MKRVAETAGNVDSPCPFLDSPSKLRNSPAMPGSTLHMKPIRWLAHLPLAILPFLAAASIEGRRLDLSTPLTGPLFLLGFHWFWMMLALALGAWVGWRTAGEEAPQSPPEGGA